MIVVLGLGIVMLVCVVVLVALLLCNNSAEEEECSDDPGGSGLAGGMQRNPELMQEIQKSIKGTASTLAKTVVGEEAEEGPYMFECLTCSLVQIGENMAYSDNTCPHCGTTMDRE